MTDYYDECGRYLIRRDKMIHETVDLEDCNIAHSLTGEIFEIQEDEKVVIGMYKATFEKTHLTASWYDLHNHFLHVGEHVLCYEYKVWRVDFPSYESYINVVSIPVSQIEEQRKLNNPSKLVKSDILMGYKGKIKVDPEGAIIIAPYIPALNITEDLVKAYDLAKKVII